MTTKGGGHLRHRFPHSDVSYSRLIVLLQLHFIRYNARTTQVELRCYTSVEWVLV